MTTNLVIFVALLIVAGGCGYALNSKMKKNGESVKSFTQVPELLTEYSGLIKSFIDDSIKIVKVDKTTSKSDFIKQVANIVATKLYAEFQSEDSLKNNILVKISEGEIELALIALFDLKPKEFDLISLYESMVNSVSNVDDTSSDTSESVPVNTSTATQTTIPTDTTTSTIGSDVTATQPINTIPTDATVPTQPIDSTINTQA